MCKELHHLMNLEELLDTLHPDAKRAVQVQLKRYEEEIENLQRDNSDTDATFNQLEDDIDRLNSEIDYLNETIAGLEEQLR